MYCCCTTYYDITQHVKTTTTNTTKHSRVYRLLHLYTRSTLLDHLCLLQFYFLLLHTVSLGCLSRQQTRCRNGAPLSYRTLMACTEHDIMDPVENFPELSENMRVNTRGLEEFLPPPKKNEGSRRWELVSEREPERAREKEKETDRAISYRESNGIFTERH